MRLASSSLSSSPSIYLPTFFSPVPRFIPCLTTFNLSTHSLSTPHLSSPVSFTSAHLPFSSPPSLLTYLPTYLPTWVFTPFNPLSSSPTRSASKRSPSPILEILGSTSSLFEPPSLGTGALLARAIVASAHVVHPTPAGPPVTPRDFALSLYAPICGVSLPIHSPTLGSCVSTY